MAVKLCDAGAASCVALPRSGSHGMDSTSPPLLDALDHLCHQLQGDPVIARQFYAATTPEQMVALAVQAGILIDGEDFRALLRSGSTEFWLVRGEADSNPIVHLRRVFRV